jgi:hypothetical protein
LVQLLPLQYPFWPQLPLVVGLQFVVASPPALSFWVCPPALSFWVCPPALSFWVCPPALSFRATAESDAVLPSCVALMVAASVA